MSHIGWVLRSVLLCKTILLKDRKIKNKILWKCGSGIELVDWLCDQMDTSRQQATIMWQVLIEEGVLIHGKILWGGTVLFQNE